MDPTEMVRVSLLALLERLLREAADAANDAVVGEAGHD
jgi:hypothetical protein